MVCSTARAQTLDLSPTTPPPEGGRLHLDLAEQLHKQADQLEKDASPANAARGQLRRLVGALLDRGAELGEGGSTHIVLAWTTRRHLPALDEQIARSGLSDTQLGLISHDLAAICDEVPADIRLVERRVRDALSPLVLAVGSPTIAAGWVDLPTTPPAPDELELRARVDRAPVRSGGDALALIAAGRAHPAYAASADRIARRLIAAARVLDLPAWVDAPVRARLAERYADAVDLLVHAEASAASERLDRLALAAQVTERLNTEPTNANTGLARTTLVDLLSSSGPIEPRPLVLADRALRLIQDAPDDAIPGGFVKLLRPSWEAIADDGRDRRSALRLMLAVILAQPDASVDPGVASAIAACGRTEREFTELRAFNTMLRGPSATKPGRAVVYRPYRALAARAAKLERQHPPDARALAAHAAHFALLAGEVSLRAAVEQNQPEQWVAGLSTQKVALLAMIDKQRRAWVEGESPGLQAAAAALDRLRRLMTLCELARARDARSMWQVQSWAGWELGDEAAAALFAGLDDRLRELTPMILAGEDGEQLDELLSETEQSYSTARLLVELDARWAALGGMAGPTGLGECVLGPPDARWGWLVGVRTEVASVCRYADEAAAMARDGDHENALRARAYADRIAARVLRKIED